MSPQGSPSGGTPAWTVFAVGVATGLVLALVLQRPRPGAVEPDVEHYRQVRDFVGEAFVRDVTPEEMVDQALHGMIERLDAYSRYYDRPEVAELERETGGRYTGFGFVLRRPFDQVRVLFTLPGSPAREAGLVVGDRLLEIDGEPALGLRLADIRMRLADGERDELELTVRSLDGAQRTLAMRRASIVEPTVRHERMLDDERGIGYLAIASFSHETPDEFDGAVGRLRERGARALVVDVRRNLGGVLTSAVEIAGRFIERGVIVSTEGRGDPVLYEADPSRALYAGLPLVVLIDGDTASASEVLAGALRDHRAAVLCGSPTYGKGMVQTIRHFPDMGAVAKVTTSYYYTPAHQNLERSARGARTGGIEPDLEVPLDELERRVVHEHLVETSPPPDALDAIRAWELAEDVTLLTQPPPDAQLEAALGLLRGERPGPLAFDRRDDG
jgi:carboxyl-terminal processing protease